MACARQRSEVLVASNYLYTAFCTPPCSPDICVCVCARDVPNTHTHTYLGIDVECSAPNGFPRHIIYMCIFFFFCFFSPYWNIYVWQAFWLDPIIYHFAVLPAHVNSISDFLFIFFFFFNGALSGRAIRGYRQEGAGVALLFQPICSFARSLAQSTRSFIFATYPPRGLFPRKLSYTSDDPRATRSSLSLSFSAPATPRHA